MVLVPPYDHCYTSSFPVNRLPFCFDQMIQNHINKNLNQNSISKELQQDMDLLSLWQQKYTK